MGGGAGSEATGVVMVEGIGSTLLGELALISPAMDCMGRVEVYSPSCWCGGCAKEGSAGGDRDAGQCAFGSIATSADEVSVSRTASVASSMAIDLYSGRCRGVGSRGLCDRESVRGLGD